MLKIAICDDDPNVLTTIHSLIHEYANTHNHTIHIDTYASGYDLLTKHKQFQYHLIFLDIIMPTIDGISIATQLRSFDSECILVFLTSSNEFTKEAYMVDAIHYLIKPIEKEKLIMILNRTTSYVRNTLAKIQLIPTKNGTEHVFLHNILYVEHINHVLHFHLTNRSTVKSLSSWRSLSEIGRQLLPNENFIQPHRAYIVNMDHINKFTKTDFIMKNGQAIPIPVRKYAEIKKQYFDYMLS